MQSKRSRRLLPFLREHWRGPVFALALLSLFLLRSRLDVEKRHAEEGKDVFQKAEAELAAGRIDSALQRYTDFLERFPDHKLRGRAYSAIADGRLREGGKDGLLLALAALHDAVKAGLPVAETLERRTSIASDLLEGGAVEEAHRELKLLAADTKDAAVQLLLARSAEGLLEEVDPARVLAATTLGVVPPGPAAAVARTGALEGAMRSRLLEEALSALNAVAARGDDTAKLTALMRRGRLLLRLHLYSEAADALGRLIDALSPRVPDGWLPDPWTHPLAEALVKARLLRGKVHLGRMRAWRDPARAIESFHRTLADLAVAERLGWREEMRPQAEEAAYLQGRACQGHQDTAEAFASYQGLLARNPSALARYACLARTAQLHLEKGDRRRCLELLQRALGCVPAGGLRDAAFTDLPDPVAILRSFPGASAGVEDPPELLASAAAVTEGFIDLYPQDPALREIDGNIRMRLGDIAAAEAEAAARRGQPKEAVRQVVDTARQEHARAGAAYAHAVDASRGAEATRLASRAGLAYARAEDPIHASRYLKAFLDECDHDDPGQPDAIYEYARAERALGDYDLALSLFGRLQTQYPNNLKTYDSRLDVAEIHRARGNLEDAIRTLSGVLLESDVFGFESPVRKESAFLLGEVRYEAAKEHERKAAEAGDGDSMKAREEEAAREARRQAQHELEAALKLYPNEVRRGIRAHEVLANLAVADNDFQRAYEHFDAISRLGSRVDEEGNVAKEEEPYKSICRNAVVRKADCLFQLGNLADAELGYQYAYRENYESAAALECLYRRAQCLRQLSRPDDALKVITQAKGTLDRLAGGRKFSEEERADWQSRLEHW